MMLYESINAQSTDPIGRGGWSCACSMKKQRATMVSY